jgi:hypothetical protein
MSPSLPTSPWLRLAARVSITLIASLAAAAIATQSATAAYNPFPKPDLTALSTAFEEEEAEAESEEWEEDELEEGEEAEPLPADTCPLRSASAHAVTKKGKLKLTIGYTTNEPFNAGVEVKQGSTRIHSVHRHFGHSGVLRLHSSQLSGKQTGRLSVRIKLPSGGSGCPSRRLVLFPH